MAVVPARGDVFIVVDVQYDFLPGGALAVPDGDAVVGPINVLAKRFRHVVFTQDWHPPGHASFATSHSGKKPFETVRLDLRRTDPLARPLRAGHPRRHDFGQRRHPARGADHPQRV